MLEPDAVDAERRLFYVGLTRAEDFLAICHSEVPALFVAEARQAVTPKESFVPERV